MKRLAPIAGLALLPFLFYWNLFIGDRAERNILAGELLSYDFVWKSIALDRIKDGEFPLWSPQALGGVALHADPRVGVFYPPNYLLLLFPSDPVMSLGVLEVWQLSHLILAGLGMWLLLRQAGLRRLAAWVGALVSMFTGFTANPGHGALILSACWIPLTLYLVRRSVESKGTRPIACAAAGLAMMFLAGDPRPAFYE